VEVIAISRWSGRVSVSVKLASTKYQDAKYKDTDSWRRVSKLLAVQYFGVGPQLTRSASFTSLPMAEVGGIPLFPTTHLHVDAAVDVALESRPTPGLSVGDRCQG